MATAMKKFFELFGELCVQLSNLEAFVTQILEYLIDKDHPNVGGLLVSELPISKKLEHIRTLAGFRFAHDTEMESAVIGIIKRINDIRIERNSFIHGMWSLDAELLGQQKVRCLDPRWRASKEEKHWGRMRETIWSFDDLQSRISEVQSVTTELFSLKEKLEASTMVGINSPEELRATRAAAKLRQMDSANSNQQG
jgi:hypothetical protein